MNTQLEDDVQSWHEIVKRWAMREDAAEWILSEVEKLTENSKSQKTGSTEWLENCRRVNKLIAFSNGIRSYHEMMLKASQKQEK